jgi:hypothetical protein
MPGSGAGSWAPSGVGRPPCSTSAQARQPSAAALPLTLTLAAGPLPHGLVWSPRHTRAARRSIPTRAQIAGPGRDRGSLIGVVMARSTELNRDHRSGSVWARLGMWPTSRTSPLSVVSRRAQTDGSSRGRALGQPRVARRGPRPMPRRSVGLGSCPSGRCPEDATERARHPGVPRVIWAVARSSSDRVITSDIAPGRSSRSPRPA